MSKKPVYKCEICDRQSVVGREFVRLRDQRGDTVVCKTCAAQLGDDAVRARHAAKPILPRPRGERTFHESTLLDAMTVGDLIAKLQKLPPDLPVSPRYWEVEDTYVMEIIGTDEYGEPITRPIRVCSFDNMGG